MARTRIKPAARRTHRAMGEMVLPEPDEPDLAQTREFLERSEA